MNTQLNEAIEATKATSENSAIEQRKRILDNQIVIMEALLKMNELHGVIEE